MRFPFHNDPAPEPVPPPHAECQPQATAALHTAVDSQGLALPVEVPASETLDHAEAAVQAVNHPHVLVIENGDVETERLDALHHGMDSAIVDAGVLVPRLEFVDQEPSDSHEAPSSR